MKKLINLILIIISLLIFTYAEAKETKLNQAISPKIKIELDKQGCCSWHDGVCGCIGGRVICCDGTFSPSCQCYYSSPNNFTPFYIYADQKILKK